MSKLILVGLAAAVLGIGGIALPSGDNNDVSSPEIANADVVTPAVADEVQPLVGSTVVTAGPFERSAAVCATGQYMCITFAGSEDPNRIVRVIDMIPGVHTWERVKALNGWSEPEVTLDTIVKSGTTIAFNVKS